MGEGMGRYQRGYIYEAFGALHVRYRTEEIVDGKLARVQRSHRLCTKEKGLTKRSNSVQRKCAEFMATVNAQVPGQPETTDLTVAAFWEQTYWPFVQANLKPSTYLGYQQVWNQHLKDHFGTVTLREYRKGMGSTFLTKLAKKYRPLTVQHIKNLASGIFTHAANLDFVESNPWSFCKVLGKSLPDGVTGVYTLEEIENIISALVEHVDCQLIMALTFFMGLRKGEIQGLQWSDIDGEYIHIRRNQVRGHTTTPKTKKSVRSIPIIQPVKTLLVLWRAKSKGDGVRVFERNLMTVARKTIRPVLEKNRLEWKGFHAGRRGLGTVLRQITGNSTAGRDVLGHEDEGITKDHYEGKLPEVAMAALKQLEAKVVEKNGVEK
jgi:integrase